MNLSNRQFLNSFKHLLFGIHLHFAMEDKSVKKLSDSELFAEISAKKASALSSLYDRYSAHLFGLAIKILKDQQAAEDVLQDLFLYIWDNADKFNERRGNSLAWVTIICRNRCIDKLRKQKKLRLSVDINEEIGQNLALDESESPLAIVTYNETSQSIKEALEKLPGEQRQPIEMAYFEGLSQTEIAAELQIPLGTIKTRMRLGMQKLRTSMKETMEK